MDWSDSLGFWSPLGFCGSLGFCGPLELSSSWRPSGLRLTILSEVDYLDLLGLLWLVSEYFLFFLAQTLRQVLSTFSTCSSLFEQPIWRRLNSYSSKDYRVYQIQQRIQHREPKEVRKKSERVLDPSDSFQPCNSPELCLNR